MKNIALVFLLYCSHWLYGQQRIGQYQFSYGISVGAEFQTLNVGALPQDLGTPFVSTQNLTGSGAGAGIWAQWPILPVLHVRPALQFSYTSNTLRFQRTDGQVRKDLFRFAEIELPLHFLLTDDFRRLPLQGVILFGGRISWNLAASGPEAALRLLPERLGLDIGIGAGFHWGKWRVEPEFVYSYGLNNVHDFQNTPYDRSVGRILRDRLSVRILIGQDFDR
ncbi:MAG: hypothetical protein IPH12_13180 [Saprospirales bacterium]|nr:hypothetical protein [Saprospirales bacterium]